MAKPSPLLLACAERPDDDAARLAHAAALGGDEGEFIQVQVARARLPRGDARDGALARQELAVWRRLSGPKVKWLRDRGAHSWVFTRGLVTGAGATSYDFLDQQAKLLRQLPTLRDLSLNVGSPKDIRALAQVDELQRLEHLSVVDYQGAANWKAWFSQPAFDRIPSLSFQVAPEAALAKELVRGRLPGLSRLERVEWPAPVLAATLPSLHKLTELTTHERPMSRAQVEALVTSGAMARLQRLSLYQARLDDAALEPLWRAPAGLRTLELLSNPLGERSLQALADSAVGQTVEALTLSFCPVGPALVALGQMPRLQHLELRRVSGVGAGLGALLAAAGPRLRTLVLGQEPLGSEGVKAIAGASLPLLDRLGLVAMDLDAAQLAAMAPALRSVLALDVSNNPKLGDAGARALHGLATLRSLRIESCDLDDGGLAGWPLEAGLSSLDVNGNHLVDKAVQQALLARFGQQWFEGPGLELGYQNPRPDPQVAPAPVEAEPPPQQRRKPAAPPLRRDRVRGLTELQTRPHFATWDGYVDAKAVAKCEQALHDAAAALLALGAKATAAQQKAVLKKCVLKLNALDEKYGCLQTIEREDVDEEFSLLVRYTPWAAWEEEEGEALLEAWRDF